MHERVSQPQPIVAVRDPLRLYAQPVGFGGDRWQLVAEDAQGNRLIIVASRERFYDALHPQGLHGVPSEAEQVRSMFMRDEVGVEDLERSIERDLRR
jgi:hypothetical protein